MPPGSDGTRKRAERLEVTLARKAASAVLNIRSKIGPWQTRAARLRGQQTHSRGQASQDKVQADAEALLVEIEGEQELLRQRAEKLPAEVTSEGHFRDVVKAVTGIANAVGQLAPERNRTPQAAPRLLEEAGPDRVLNLVVKCRSCGKPSRLTILGAPRAHQRVDCPLCGEPIGQLEQMAAAALPAA